MPGGRPSNQNERRRQILEGLLEVMASEGFQKASVQKIARAAGLTPGLIHYHFPSKKAVLLGLIDELGERFDARRRRIATGDSPGETLRAYVEAFLAPGGEDDRHAARAWVAIGSEAVRDPEVRARYAAVVEERLGQLEALLADLGLHAARRRRARAAALLSALDGALQLGLLAPEAFPEGAAATAVLESVWDLIEGAPAGAR